jgi:hypothetical protein
MPRAAGQLALGACRVLLQQAQELQMEFIGDHAAVA